MILALTGLFDPDSDSDSDSDSQIGHGYGYGYGNGFNPMLAGEANSIQWAREDHHDPSFGGF